MAAPLSRLCFKNLCVLKKIHTFQRCLHAPLAKYTQTATSHQAADAKVLVPKKKKRDDLAVLRALESTVEWDPSAPHYRFMDDPYLLPLNNNHKIQNDLSYISGVKAARYVMKNYPEPFLVRPFEDFSYTREGFRFKGEPTHSQDTLEGLQERIDMELTVEAYKCYTGLLENGIDVPPSARQDLLELLCFYNSENPATPPIPLENAHKTWDTTYSKKKAFSWKVNGLADQMFQSLENPDQKAHSTMLRGHAKYGDTQGTLIYLDRMKSANMEIGLKEYNAVLQAYMCVVNPDNRALDRAKRVLVEMSERGIDPNLYTFNSLLQIVATSQSHKRKEWALDVIQEMRQCGVEPSPGSYQLLLHACFSRKSDPQSHLLWEIVNDLKGKDLPVRHPTDYNFFPDIMKRCGLLSDLKLAHAINDLLQHGKNFHLLATVQNQQIYYFYYLSMVFLFDELDRIMEAYYKYIPNTFMPNTDMMQSLLRAISLHNGYQYLPAIWSDIFRMFEVRQVKRLTGYFLSVMSEAKTEKEMQQKFVDIVQKVWEIRQTDDRFQLTGGMLGEMCQVSLNADRQDLAWQYFEEAYKHRKTIEGFMRQNILTALADIFIEAKDIAKLMKICTLLADMVSPELDKVMEKMRSQLELTPQEISFLECLNE